MTITLSHIIKKCCDHWHIRADERDFEEVVRAIMRYNECLMPPQCESVILRPNERLSWTNECETCMTLFGIMAVQYFSVAHPVIAPNQVLLAHKLNDVDATVIYFAKEMNRQLANEIDSTEMNDAAPGPEPRDDF